MLALIVVFIGALVAFSVSALAGGGAGLVMMPLLGMVLPVTHVPAALSIGTAVSSASRLAVFRKAVRWDVFLWFVPAALPMAVLGAWLLTLTEPSYLQLVLGLFLIGELILACHSAAAPAQSAKPPKVLVSHGLLAVIGAAAGLISGFTGVVGAVFNGFYLRFGLSKEEIVATRAANEILLHLVKIGMYVFFGLVDSAAALVGSLVAIAAVFAAFGAKRLLAGLSERTFRRINHAAMGIAGASLLASSGSALAAQHDIAFRTSFQRAGVEIELRRRHWAMSVEWKKGEAPQFERTITSADLPAHLQAAVEAVSAGAKHIIYEQVISPDRTGFEVSVQHETSKVTLNL